MTGFHTDFPWEGEMYMHTKGAFVCWCPHWGFIDFNEILDIFNYKNRQI